MSRIQMTQAVAADYADAMLVARRAKNTLFLLLSLVLLIQLATFFVVRYVPGVTIRPVVTFITATTAPAVPPVPRFAWPQTLEYLLAGTNYLGILLPVVLSAILLLILVIMLVGRLVGVSHVTSAFCWSILLLVMLIPWQSLFNVTAYRPPSTADTAVPAVRDVRIPGVLYTFPELVQNYDFQSSDWKDNAPAILLHWARFAGFPVIAMIILLMVQGKSGRGLRLALGEAEVSLKPGVTA